MATRRWTNLDSLFAAVDTGPPPQSTSPFTRKYLNLLNDPLFHFGHGLFFASVRLTNLRATAEESDEDAPVKIEVEASNDGKVATEETLFLFLHDVVASVARPMFELKEWTKVALGPGETRTVSFFLFNPCACASVTRASKQAIDLNSGSTLQ